MDVHRQQIHFFYDCLLKHFSGAIAIEFRINTVFSLKYNISVLTTDPNQSIFELLIIIFLQRYHICLSR